MLPEHHIEWIAIEQNHKTQIAFLTPADEPKAEFTVDATGDITAYEHCNLHGLWLGQ